MWLKMGQIFLAMWRLMKCKTNWVTVWGCFVGLQVALNVVTFED